MPRAVATSAATCRMVRGDVDNDAPSKGPPAHPMLKIGNFSRRRRNLSSRWDERFGKALGLPMGVCVAVLSPSKGSDKGGTAGAQHLILRSQKAEAAVLSLRARPRRQQ